MKISRISALIALAALALVAGCTASSSGQRQDAMAGSNPAMTTAGRSGNDQASPYDQPLMATGGDMVMLNIVSRGIAG